MDESRGNAKFLILIVDDDSIIRKVLTSGLQKAGYDTLEAESGEQAIEVLTQHTPDLALLDISMGGMSGIELARRIRFATNIPFMFISTHNEAEFVASAIEHGAVGYLVKPVDITTALPAIKVALAGAQEIRRLRHTEATLNTSLAQAHERLAESDKLASIGQLATGVAHEINNPIGYVSSNLGSLEGYVQELFKIVDSYTAIEALPENSAEKRAALDKLRATVDIEFLREDIPALLGESKEGITRVRQIVQDLKDFSHVDTSNAWQWASVHRGLDSTLNVINNEIKYRAEVVRDYADFADIECLPGPLNQVFMNLLVNAAHAIPDGRHGTITVRTGAADDKIWVEISDNGDGIAPENLERIFNPFFTTKPIGKGTGLGLPLSLAVVEKHGGTLEVKSQLGEGTQFRVTLPKRQTEST